MKQEIGGLTTKYLSEAEVLFSKFQFGLFTIIKFHKTSLALRLPQLIHSTVNDLNFYMYFSLLSGFVLMYHRVQVPVRFFEKKLLLPEIFCMFPV